MIKKIILLSSVFLFCTPSVVTVRYFGLNEVILLKKGKVIALDTIESCKGVLKQAVVKE